MEPKFSSLVRANAKKIADAPVPFYYAAIPAQKRSLAFVGGLPGKATLFGSLTKIQAHLSKKSPKEPALPKVASFCSGTVVRIAGQLQFDVVVKKGVSSAAMMRGLKLLNQTDKLGLGAFGLVGEESEEDETVSLEAEEEIPSGVEEEEPEEEESEDESEEEESEEEPADEEPESPPKEVLSATAPPPSEPPPSGAAIQKLRGMMKARAATFQKGEIGVFAYFSAAHDGPPLLVLSKPGAVLEGQMLKAGLAVSISGDWRCVVPGGLELYPLGFDTAGVAAELGVRFRAAAGPIRREASIDARTAALDAYVKARDTVMERLKSLAKEVNSIDHPLRDNAMIELRAVRANLTARPETRAAAHELKRYLETDEVVADIDQPDNGFATPVAVRATLLEPLNSLIAELS